MGARGGGAPTYGGAESELSTRLRGKQEGG